MRYYDRDGNVAFETPKLPPGALADLGTKAVVEIPPEPLHTVECIDDVEFLAIRIELRS